MTTLGGIHLPDVYVQETSRRIIGGNIVRAVDGTAHRASTRIVRTWAIETRPMTYAQFKELEQMYLSSNGGAVAMHLDEWDSGFVDVFILEFSDSRSMIPDGATNSARTVRIVVEEA